MNYAVVLVSIFAGIIFGFLFFYLLSRRWVAAYKFQSEGPRFSGREVEGLLNKAGFQVLERQPKKSVLTNINGKDHFGFVEADYLVQKDKRRYVLVVHTGEGAPDPNEPNFRRRLLEHDYVFSPDGILVMDANKGEIHGVSFRFPHERNIDFFFRLLIALFIILLVIGIIWLLVQLHLF